MATESAAKKDLGEIQKELNELLKFNHAFAVMFRAMVDNYKEIVEAQKKSVDKQTKQQEDVNKDVEKQESKIDEKLTKYKDAIKKFGKGAIKIYENFEKFHDDYKSEIEKFKGHLEKQIYGSVPKGEKILEGGLLVNIKKFASDPDFGKVLAQRVKDKILTPFRMVGAVMTSIGPGFRMFASIGKNLLMMIPGMSFVGKLIGSGMKKLTSFGKNLFMKIPGMSALGAFFGKWSKKDKKQPAAEQSGTSPEKSKQKGDNTINFLSGALGNLFGLGANTGESEGEIESDADRVKRHQEEAHYREKVLEYLALIVGQDKHSTKEVSVSEKESSGKGFFGSMLDMVDNILDITRHAKHGWRYLKTNIRWMSRGAYWRGLGTRIIGIMRSPLMRFAGGIAGAAMMAADAIGGVKKSTEWLGKKDGNTTAGKVASGIGGALGGTGPGLFDKGDAMDKAKNIAGGAMKGAAIGMMFGPLGALIGGGIGAVFSAIGGKNIAKALNWVWKGLKSLFGAIWKGISFIAKPIIKYVKWVWGIWKKVFGFVFGIFGEIWDAVKSIFGFGKKGKKEGFFTKLWNIAKWLMPWYWAFRIGKALWDWASGLVNKVLEFFGFGQNNDSEGGFFSKIWNIAKWLNPIYLAYKVGEAIWGWVSGMVSSVLSWFGLGDDAEEEEEEGGFWDTILSIASWLNPFKLLGKIAEAIIDTLSSFAKKILGWFGIDIEDIRKAAQGKGKPSAEAQKVEHTENANNSNDSYDNRVNTTNVTINTPSPTSTGDSKYLNKSQLKELDKLVQANEREGLTIEEWVDKYGLESISSDKINTRKYGEDKLMFLSDKELARESKSSGARQANRGKIGLKRDYANLIVENAKKHKYDGTLPTEDENKYGRNMQQGKTIVRAGDFGESHSNKPQYVTSTPVFVNQNKADYLTSVAYPVTQ